MLDIPKSEREENSGLRTKLGLLKLTKPGDSFLFEDNGNAGILYVRGVTSKGVRGDYMTVSGGGQRSYTFKQLVKINPKIGRHVPITGQ